MLQLYELYDAPGTTPDRFLWHKPVNGFGNKVYLILWCQIVGKDYRKCANDDFLGLLVGEETVNRSDQVAYGFNVAGGVGYDFLQYFAQENACSDAWNIVGD
jgi:hypothetical protein